MKHALLVVLIRTDADMVTARQRSRQIAELLGFEKQEQARIVTAVSELVRNVLQHAGSGKVQFAVEVEATIPSFVVIVKDRGPGMLVNVPPATPRAIGRISGLASARRMMDELTIDTAPDQGTTVRCRKRLRRSTPHSAQSLGLEIRRQLAAALSQDEIGDPFNELRQQNEELANALDALEQRHEEVKELNRELEETNRGVVALYAELDERAESLRRTSEIKNRFLSHATHEFRTPLNSILNLSRILLSGLDGTLGEEQKRQVCLIQRSAESLSELVNELLDVAKVESGKVVLNFTEFSLPEMLRALKGVMRPLQKEPIELIFDVPEDLPPIRSDESKLTQVLRNLLSNALKFTENGHVCLSVTLDREGFFQFEVVDTGIGIASENLEVIFEEFVQIQGEHQRGVHGSGLGLSLARRLVAVLGGDLKVSSQLGEGTRFYFSLPADSYGEVQSQALLPAPPAEEPVASQVLRPARTILKRVLIVDDDEATRYSLSRLFEGMGLEAFAASDGATAQRLAQEVVPDLLVLDLLMPNTDGFYLARCLNKLEVVQSATFVLHTSKTLNHAEHAQARELSLHILSKSLSEDTTPQQHWRAFLQSLNIPTIEPL